MARPNRKAHDSQAGHGTFASGARLRLAARALLQALDTYLLETLAAHGEMDGSGWGDQDESPLRKRAHLKAVRDGELPGVKKGKRVFVRKRDLDEYLTQHAVPRRRAGDPARTERSLDAAAVAARGLEELGLEIAR